MMLVKEISKWTGVSRQPNHTYLISEDYSKIFGYFKWNNPKEFEMFKAPIRFNTRYRQFKVMKRNINFAGQKSSNKTWEVAGSKGSIHVVEETAHGLSCSCIGYKYHGKCKHIDEVSSK